MTGKTSRNVTQSDRRKGCGIKRIRNGFPWVHLSRFSIRAPPPTGGQPWPREGGFSSPPTAFGSSSRVDREASFGRNAPPLGTVRRGPGAYAITLIHEGASANCLVWPTMMILQLKAEAARIFLLDTTEKITLVLFSAMPETLRNGDITGPPRIVP